MWHGMFLQNFFIFWMPFQNQKTTKEFHSSSCIYKIILYFLYAIYKHCKWIMLIGITFINERGHIKTLKIITRTVDFGIPTIKIFLNKKYFGVQLALYKFPEISTSTSSYFRYSNQILGSMNKCSVSKKPHLIGNRLIIFKVWCFDVKVPWWFVFKGVSSLSDLCSARNVNALLDDVTGLDVIYLLPISDSSSDKIIIALCAIWTRSS